MEFGRIADWHQTDDVHGSLWMKRTIGSSCRNQMGARGPTAGREPGRENFNIPEPFWSWEAVRTSSIAGTIVCRSSNFRHCNFSSSSVDSAPVPESFSVLARLHFRDPWVIVADTNNARLSFHLKDGKFLFSSGISGNRFPRKVRSAHGPIEVQYEDGEWSRPEFV